MDLISIYNEIKKDIDEKFDTFAKTWSNGDGYIIEELLFSICTPQSKAQSAAKAIKELSNQDLIYHPNVDKIAIVLSESGVRFKNRKASYIMEALSRFNHRNISIKKFIYNNISVYGISETRNWLAKNVKGIGMKEASHFLRNIGYGEDLAILDRHILRKLDEHAGIKQPKRLGKKEYLEIEEEMFNYSKEIGISMFDLDFVFWAETHKGELFDRHE